ncbi:MAG: NUDIX hydrolase [Candidatus Nealsonbacteria bacterium]|nr:NUDIX hydrolase [Candidatus Nealsonbacteria bacterium]
MENIDARVLILDDNHRVLFVLEKEKLVTLPNGANFTKPSKWGMPGGRGEAEDGDEIDAVIREVKEEVGLSVYIDEQSRVGRQEKGYSKVVFIGELAAGTIKINPEEILDCKWFPIRVLYDNGFNMYSSHRQMAQELLRKLGK